MAFPNGPLAGHFQTSQVPGLLNGEQQRHLPDTTRGLIVPFLANTVFCRGVLALSFVRAVPTFTIFARRNLGNVPYLLTDLGRDLQTTSVDRTMIDLPTESTIRALAADLVHTAMAKIIEIIERDYKQAFGWRLKLNAPADHLKVEAGATIRNIVISLKDLYDDVLRALDAFAEEFDGPKRAARLATFKRGYLTMEAVESLDSEGEAPRQLQLDQVEGEEGRRARGCILPAAADIASRGRSGNSNFLQASRRSGPKKHLVRYAWSRVVVRVFEE